MIKTDKTHENYFRIVHLNDSYDYTQHMFSWRNKKNVSQFISKLEMCPKDMDAPAWKTKPQITNAGGRLTDRQG